MPNENWSDFEKEIWKEVKALRKDVSGLKSRVATISAVMAAMIYGTVDVIKKKLFHI